MNIWQVGVSSNPYTVDGVCRTAWLLSAGLAEMGHQITLLIDGEADPTTVETARKINAKLVSIEPQLLSYAERVRKLLRGNKPDIVHMHSVFVVRQALLARELKDAGIPYVITPHGGLSPGVLSRGRIKKSIYSVFSERPRFHGADAIALVTPGEDRIVRTFLGNNNTPMIWMPNPVETKGLEAFPWQGPPSGDSPKKLIYLGRFDVIAKGIDILVEVGRHLPEFKIEIYGTEDRRTLPQLEKIKQNLPPNVSFNDPIFGDQKLKALSSATMYIQTARWEGFPVSVAEALSMGVPTIISNVLAMSPLYRQHDLGLLVPIDPPRAADMIRKAVADESKLRDWSRKGRQFTRRYFHIDSVVARHTKLYEQIIAGQRIDLGDRSDRLTPSLSSMRGVRVHIYLREFPPQGDRLSSGMIKAVHGLAAGFVNNGTNVTVLCDGTENSVVASPSGYDIRSFAHEDPSAGPGIPRALEQYIDQCNDPGLFLLNGVFNSGVFHISRACMRNRIPYIAAPHDPYHPSIFATNSRLKWSYWRLRERPMLQQAMAVQVLDFRHAEWLRAMGVHTPVIEVLNGYTPEDVPAESSLSWRLEGAPRLLFLGRLQPHDKGLDLLLDAFSQMLHQTDAMLTLQGPDSHDRDALKRYALKLNLGTRVQFRDSDYDKSATAICAEHDIVLLPSRFEGFGLPALEAMLAARVVLVSDIAGIAPHVRASGCGIVVSTNVEQIKSGLAELLAMRPKWKQMGLAGREYALRHLRWDRIAAETMEHYREARNGNGAGHKEVTSPVNSEH